jgi:hypothetical protein
MYCSQCGTQVPDEAAFCPACGARSVSYAAAAPAKRRLPYILAAAGILGGILVAVLVAAMLRGGGGNGSSNEQAGAVAPVAPVLTATATPVITRTPTPPATPSPAQSSDTLRLLISSINVDAPVAREVVPSNGEMPPPRDGEVVWYDFSKLSGFGGRPCAGGNTVLSGNVGTLGEDWVLRDLGELILGAEVVLRLGDGTECKFSVQSNRLVDRNASSWNEIVSETAKESLTIISATDFQGKKMIVSALRFD